MFQKTDKGSSTNQIIGDFDDPNNSFPDEPQAQLNMQDADDCLPPIGDTARQHSDSNVQFRGLAALPPGHVPSYRAVFLIANAALGAGLLNFPQAYMNAGGIEIAITLQAGLLIFIIGAFLILARCADHSQAATYQDVLLYMLGKRVKNVSQIFIALYFFGSAMTYIIIIGEQLSSVLEFASNTSGNWYTDKRFLFCLFALLFLLPLCIPRRLKALSYTSFFGGVGAFFIAFVIVYKYFKLERKKIIQPDKVINTDWKSAFAAIPVICFGFQCHVSSVAVYAELKNRSIKKFFSCAMVAMVVCTITYCLSGSFGYKTFGSLTKADILENYSNDDTLVNIARISIVFILLSSFSIVTFCARTVIDGMVLSVRNMTVEEGEPTERRRRVIVTLCWFAACLFIASVVPDIGVAIAVIGGIASLFIFVFPGLCLLQTVDLKKRKLSPTDICFVVISVVYLVVGAFIFGEVTTLALQSDITGKQLQ
ncbi:sodium-coupled neutral amino acid transporter 7-like [Hydractinia symbiolongicarpus]|uniref:sodium-coupled neutral amino acid transporter 7-like n=1 Tax=Hydractinia symbiolongicarpus TaxID=13093 RepID=UPI0025509290|nr:sodium-coupled neutral amino acid transporter 7-like [Hydractinia symbiolongicarpus]